MTKDLEISIDTNTTNPNPEIVDNSAIHSLSELVREKIAKVMSVNNSAGHFKAYESDFSENLHPENNLTFLISPNPFQLPPEVERNLEKYGRAISAFYRVCDAIFRKLPENHKWKKILNNNRPQWLLNKAREEEDKISHLFLRPDFILTEGGVLTAEIETSPFGLALALFLNKAYSGEEGKFIDIFLEEVMKNDETKSLCLMLTEHTKKYRGQFEYLAKLLFEKGINVTVVMPDEVEVKDQECFTNGKKIDLIYRGFYLHESTKNENLAKIMQSNAQVFPGTKSHLEEKAMMAMFFDPELNSTFQNELAEHHDLLKTIFPSTYVLGENPPSEMGISKWEELANIPREKRLFVLKSSGFTDKGSWCKGVQFLNKLSKNKCVELIRNALSGDDVFIIQEFKKGKNFEQEYFDFRESLLMTMNGRVRFTPYFSVSTGELLTAKATMCEGTDFIHASTNSINSPVKWK